MKKGYLILQDGQVFEGVRFDALSDSIKVAEKRMVEVQALQQHIKNYRNTRQIYIEYRKSGADQPERETEPVQKRSWFSRFFGD